MDDRATYQIRVAYRTGLSDGRYGYSYGSGYEKNELVGEIGQHYKDGYEQGCFDRKREPERYGKS